MRGYHLHQWPPRCDHHLTGQFSLCGNCQGRKGLDLHGREILLVDWLMSSQTATSLVSVISFQMSCIKKESADKMAEIQISSKMKMWPKAKHHFDFG